MKPQLLKITTPSNSSFNLFVQEAPYFATPWHYHPEYEIVLVLESTGKRFVGSNVSTFQPGDLCMIGSFLPHYYRNDAQYYAKDKEIRARSLVIHFKEEFLGTEFFSLPECQSIKRLLERSKRGLSFGEETVAQISARIQGLKHLSEIYRLIELIAILTFLSEAKDTKELTTNSVSLQNEVDSARINAVLDFISHNFQQDIQLVDAAKLANMSESAFSRYFKKRTRRTFSQFVVEMRIEHACKLLAQDKMSVSAISIESGYNNLSNFNRQFKSLKQTTPLAYRSTFNDGKC